VFGLAEYTVREGSERKRGGWSSFCPGKEQTPMLR
jgi:hypothetical protein